MDILKELKLDRDCCYFESEWKKYQATIDEITALRARIAELEAQLAESIVNDRTAMGYLSIIRKIVGGDDFPDMVRRIAELERGQVPGWISVIDELPAKGFYLVTFKTDEEEGLVTAWEFDGNNWLSDDREPLFCKTYYLEVTHWMPMPSAPSADSGEVNAKPTYCSVIKADKSNCDLHNLHCAYPQCLREDSGEVKP